MHKTLRAVPSLRVAVIGLLLIAVVALSSNASPLTYASFAPLGCRGL